jgi:cysteine desulfurase
VDFESLGVSLMTISAHKMGGPVGVGALLKKPHVALTPLLHGGGHEQGLRAGTENVPLIVGFGKMCALAKEQQVARQTHFKQRQMHLEAQLARLEGVRILAKDSARLPNTTLIAVEKIDGEMLIMALDKKGISAASGSACGSLSAGGSHVIQAMRVPEPWASNTVRISVGWNTTEEECDAFIHALQDVMAESKQMSWR